MASCPLAFVDTETISLDPNLDPTPIWEVALILRREEGTPDIEYEWWLPVPDLGIADPISLRIGRFYQRHPDFTGMAETTSLATFAREFSVLTQGTHLVGAVPSFDSERLIRLLRSNGACPGWHYHLVDVEALAAGYLGVQPPWRSDDLTAMLSVTVSEEDKHTALGDARWAAAIYDAVYKAER